MPSPGTARRSEGPEREDIPRRGDHPQRDNDPQREDDPRKAAWRLIKHSLCAGAAFCAVILIAVGIEKFGDLLVLSGWVKSGEHIYWACLVGQDILLVGDVVLLVAIFFKLGYRFYRDYA